MDRVRRAAVNWKSEKQLNVTVGGVGGVKGVRGGGYRVRWRLKRTI